MKSISKQQFVKQLIISFQFDLESLNYSTYFNFTGMAVFVSRDFEAEISAWLFFATYKIDKKLPERAELHTIRKIRVVFSCT